MFLTKEDEDKYKKWTKKDIYEAYLTEVNTRKMLNTEVNRLLRQIAELKHDNANML